MSNFEPIFASNSKTAHFERKRWAPPFKPCPRGVHWWWSRPNWLSLHREKWIGPSKNGNLGPLWVETKNSFLGLRKENATLACPLPLCVLSLEGKGAKLSSVGDFHYIRNLYMGVWVVWEHLATMLRGQSAFARARSTTHTPM